MQMIWHDRLDAMNIRDTGKGYKRGNDGDLKVLGKDYRKEHNLGKFSYNSFGFYICST